MLTLGEASDCGLQCVQKILTRRRTLLSAAAITLPFTFFTIFLQNNSKNNFTYAVKYSTIINGK